MNTGVYIIENKVNGRIYVGSSVNIKKRWRQHARALEAGKHHSRFMQRAWDKYGKDAFVFRVALACREKHCLMYEQAYIDGLKPDYNSRPNASSQLGYKHTAETRAKMSASRPRDFSPMTGKKHNPEIIKKMSENRRGKGCGERSAEWRANISRATKGRKVSQEHREKIANTLKGHKQSQETIEKRMQKLRGRKMPASFCKKTSERMSGRKVPADTVMKMRKTKSRLSDDQVREIRCLLSEGVSQKEIGRQFGVDPSVISNIKTRKAYDWVG